MCLEKRMRLHDIYYWQMAYGIETVNGKEQSLWKFS